MVVRARVCFFLVWQLCAQAAHHYPCRAFPLSIIFVCLFVLCMTIREFENTFSLLQVVDVFFRLQRLFSRSSLDERGCHEILISEQT